LPRWSKAWEGAGDHARKRPKRQRCGIGQDEEVVTRILATPDTLIAHVAIEEGFEVVDLVETLAMQVFQPRFNIKDVEQSEP
jgi:hypothetical protein